MHSATLLTRLAGLVPHDVRRAAHRMLRPSAFEAYQSRRRVTDAQGYSLAPFDRTRSIFVHIPKAAGVSVATSLYGCLGGGHLSLVNYQLIFPKREFDQYFKFAFVRNPWDRLFSAYHFLRGGGMNEADAAWAKENLAGYATFDDFVTRWLRPERRGDFLHFWPQKHFLAPLGGERVGVDFVGYFENLADDFAAVRRRVLGDGDQPLESRNRTASREKVDFREAYTDAARRVVEEVYADDIQLLGYAFDNASLAEQIARRPPLAG